MTAEAAAALLGISTTILAAWEERFGFPVPVRSEDGQHLYPDEVMLALRIALGRTLSVASAVIEARRMQPIGSRTSSGRTGAGGWVQKPEEAR